MNPRWLLPFTHGVDMRAIDYLVSLAGNNGATLIPVSLVSVPNEGRSRGARLEHIQQSKDFLEAVKYKAARYGVPVERFEVFTADIVQSINIVANESAKVCLYPAHSCTGHCCATWRASLTPLASTQSRAKGCGSTPSPGRGKLALAFRGGTPGHRKGTRELTDGFLLDLPGPGRDDDRTGVPAPAKYAGRGPAT